MVKDKNIKQISDNALCIGCGSCVGVCKKEAISIKRNGAGFLIADVDLKLCVGCKMCLNVCSGYKKNNNHWNFEQDNLLNQAKAYITYSTDDDVRVNSQSGGFVTSILSYLLEKKNI